MSRRFKNCTSAILRFHQGLLPRDGHRAKISVREKPSGSDQSDQIGFFRFDPITFFARIFARSQNLLGWPSLLLPGKIYYINSL